MQSNQSGRADTFPGQDGAPIPLSDKQGPSETSSTTFELTKLTSPLNNPSR